MPDQDFPLPSFANLRELMDHVTGAHDANMQRDRPYSGQPHTTTGVRGATEIKGITFRDLRDCFIRAFIMSHEYNVPGTVDRLEPNATLIDEAHKGPNAALASGDVYTLKGDFDPIAVAQNLSCEVERIMGIFPNVPKLRGTQD